MLQDTSLIPTLLRAYSEAVTMIGGIRVDIVPSSLWLLVVKMKVCYLVSIIGTAN